MSVEKTIRVLSANGGCCVCGGKNDLIRYEMQDIDLKPAIFLMHSGCSEELKSGKVNRPAFWENPNCVIETIPKK